MLKHQSLKAAVECEGKTQVCYRGKIHHLPAVCPHQGAALAQGKIDQGALYCPWHGRRFELK